MTSQTIYDWARHNLQTGKWSHTDGIVMDEYKYAPDTMPDPVVGAGYYMFPVLQYLDGEGKIIYPPDWAEEGLRLKP
jgi:branched-chain amino acid transport system substrate-binding protein